MLLGIGALSTIPLMISMFRKSIASSTCDRRSPTSRRAASIRGRPARGLALLLRRQIAARDFGARTVYAMPHFVASHGRRIESASPAGSSFHVSAVKPTAGFGSTTSSGPFLPLTTFHDASSTLAPSSFLISMLTSG